MGSGFVIDPTGYIVTNNHVVTGSTEIGVRFSNGKNLKARIIGTDVGTDIALLKIDGSPPLPSVKFADDSRVKVGDWVLGRRQSVRVQRNGDCRYRLGAGTR